MSHPPVPHFFQSAKDFRAWLEANHTVEKELLVGYYKVGTGKPSMQWSESVDEALCFGWIDGIRKSLGEESYCIRFTPRKANSIWSAVNIGKMKELMEKGLVFPMGLEIYAKRQDSKSEIYAYEGQGKLLSDNYLQQLKANDKAFQFFRKQAPSYQRSAEHWVMSAKQEATQIKRLKELIADSEAQLKVKAYRR